MATISTLNSKLTLNTKSFQTGVDRAKALAGKFGSGIARNTVRVAKYGGALTAAAVGGVALITKHHLDAIDASREIRRLRGDLHRSTRRLPSRRRFDRDQPGHA